MRLGKKEGRTERRGRDREAQTVCVRVGCGNEVVFNTLDCVVARGKLFNRIEHKDAIKQVQPE